MKKVTEDAAQELLSLAKRIIKVVHVDFLDNPIDNSVHIPSVRKIIRATQDHRGDNTGRVEEILKEYAFELFL